MGMEAPSLVGSSHGLLKDGGQWRHLGVSLGRSWVFTCPRCYVPLAAILAPCFSSNSLVIVLCEVCRGRYSG